MPSTIRVNIHLLFKVAHTQHDECSQFEGNHALRRHAVGGHFGTHIMALVTSM